MSNPFLVKGGPSIVTLPSQGGRDNFGKVPQSPPPVGRNNVTPQILTRVAITRCPVCGRPRCGRRHGKRGRHR